MNLSHLHNVSANTSVNAASRGTFLIVVESCIFVIMDITALFGNILVCLAFYRNPSLRTVTNYFVLSLAFTDLFMALMVMPVYTVSTISNKWIAGNFGCKLNLVFSHILAATSLLTVMLLTINRYFCVVRPSMYTSIFSKKRSIAMAACAWVITAVTAIGLFTTEIHFKTFAVQPATCYWFFTNAIAFILFRMIQIVYMSVTSVVIVVCYVKIHHTIWQHNIACASSLQGRHSVAYGVEEAKITRTLSVVVVAFYICWVPVLVTTILRTLNALGPTAIKYYNFYSSFPLFACSVINPVIYATTSRPFRNEFLRILRR